MRPLLALLLSACALPAAAAGIHPVEDLSRAAEAFVAAHLPQAGDGNIEVEAGYLDRRLRLDPCGAPLETAVSSGDIGPGNLTVSVRCAGPSPWTLHVPVEVRVVTEVVVLARPVSRGDALSPEDVRLEPRDVTRYHRGYFTALDQVVGRELRRSSGVGQILSDLIVRRPLWVRRGERVSLVAGTGRFQVRMQGEVLADGGQGDTVRVKNLSSERVVEGKVTAPGRVRVHL
jgi:flagella basal body P-ring formation protein FlgA